MKADKRTQRLARSLLKISLDDTGRPSSEHVAGVLAYIEKTKPSNALALLQTYHRLLAVEVARTQALIEHAGPVSDATIAQIVAAMMRHYGRAITPLAKSSPELLAGLRVRVGDDVYDSSAAGTLEQLAAGIN